MKDISTKPGIFGSILTFFAGIVSWSVRHDAELRALWLLLAIFIAILTAAWWVRKWYRSFFHPKQHRPEHERPKPRI